MSLSLVTATAAAQSVGKFSLDRFEPAPAGDRFFGVPGGDPGGELTLRAMLLGDYAYRPLVLYVNDGDKSAGNVVKDQLFLHAGLSLGLFDRLNLSFDVPIAVVNDGDSPAVGGIAVPSPSGAALGDIRFTARVRLVGEARSPAELDLGGSLWVPTGDPARFTGDNTVRGLPELVFSGEADVVAYAAHAGVTFRGSHDVLQSAVGNELTTGAAVGLLFADKKLQIGPEVYGSTTLKNAFERSDSNFEGILGARFHAAAWVFGAGAGPGFTRGLGTPALRAVASVAYAPEREVKQAPSDRDHDGIVDADDACPDTPGIKSDDPKKNGCPDRDKDGIFDGDDACPDEPGVANDDPKKNGCPADRDGDGILDRDDACPDTAGVANDDPKKNGCPPDRDGDGIFDQDDACPDVPGVKSDDKEQNGCPGDRDGDGIRDDKDACPDEKGKPDPDPAKNGCPSLVRVTKTEIVILQQVQFKTGSDVILPASDELLGEVADVLREHPEIKNIEVQGHTDNRGSAAYNKKLSERRATSVVRWLTTRGDIDDSRLTPRGYGMDQPLDDNSTEAGRQRNRRVQFKITSMQRSGDAGGTGE
ncbi:MAG TPA: OmpA family protein [Polyangiaceae bacterium]|nr:OmpA family protein [Polyangiaceae bacterium]